MLSIPFDHFSRMESIDFPIREPLLPDSPTRRPQTREGSPPESLAAHGLGREPGVLIPAYLSPDARYPSNLRLTARELGFAASFARSRSWTRS